MAGRIACTAQRSHLMGAPARTTAGDILARRGSGRRLGRRYGHDRRGGLLRAGWCPACHRLALARVGLSGHPVVGICGHQRQRDSPALEDSCRRFDQLVPGNLGPMMVPRRRPKSLPPGPKTEPTVPPTSVVADSPMRFMPRRSSHSPVWSGVGPACERLLLFCRSRIRPAAGRLAKQFADPGPAPAREYPAC